MKYFPVLNEQEINKCLSDLNNLKQYYTDFPEGFYLQTLGAATYQHCYDSENEDARSLNQNDMKQTSYARIKKDINPILKQSFGWVYDKICSRILEEISEPCIVDKSANLAFPGFHIIYSHKNSHRVTEAIHLDYQWKAHIDNLKSIFKSVNEENFLTFTLCIKTPINGCGLYYWPLKKAENYSFEEAEKEYEYIKNTANTIQPFSAKNEGCDRVFYENELKPSILNYKQGFITLLTQPILHQVMPFNLPFIENDTRITMQGHGIKCDGIWRLYF